MSKSRPTTPSGDLLTPTESSAKKLKRRSKLFGGGGSSDERMAEFGGESPLAWVVGHKGKLSYNLTMLLNGEKVSN